MNKLLKTRIKWGAAILVGLAVSIFTADDQYDQNQIASSGLTHRILSKTQAITSPILFFSSKNKACTSKPQVEPQNNERKVPSEKDTLHPSRISFEQN